MAARKEARPGESGPGMVRASGVQFRPAEPALRDLTRRWNTMPRLAPTTRCPGHPRDVMRQPYASEDAEWGDPCTTSCRVNVVRM